jgi:acyl carrier protein
MDPIDVFARLQNLLHERYGLDRAVLVSDARLRDLGVDSLHVAELVVDLETELDIRIDDLEMPPDPSLGQVVAVLSKGLDGRT